MFQSCGPLFILRTAQVFSSFREQNSGSFRVAFLGFSAIKAGKSYRIIIGYDIIDYGPVIIKK